MASEKNAWCSAHPASASEQQRAISDSRFMPVLSRRHVLPILWRWCFMPMLSKKQFSIRISATATGCHENKLHSNTFETAVLSSETHDSYQPCMDHASFQYFQNSSLQYVDMEEHGAGPLRVYNSLKMHHCCSQRQYNSHSSFLL